MLNTSQLKRVVAKVKRFEATVESLIFEKVDTVEVSAKETMERIYTMPDDLQPIKKGDTWGKEGSFLWAEGSYTVPKHLEGQDLYVMPKLGGYEGILVVNDLPYGNYATKISSHKHGNHYCDKFATSASGTYKLGFEFYSGHDIMGRHPFDDDRRHDFGYTFDEVAICTKNDEIADFYFNLRLVNELYDVLGKESFRSANLLNAIVDCNNVLYYDIDNVSRETFIDCLKKANEILKPVLAMKNGDTMPTLAVMGHSHMDTAWLWPMAETIKKCARTFANQINLMDQYPEYIFMQSSAYHIAMMERHYPKLFEAMKEKIMEGRYEPNGGVWVECDCNITSGESMIRQFLWGQKYTQKHFNYTADSFILPDTFGYSAALPQIMKGSKVDYFLTTKMAWNDVTVFPYTSFYWEGMDGTKVLSHLNKLNMWPTPKDIIPATFDDTRRDGMYQRHVSDKRIYTYGYGDGGGGPQFEMIEMLRRSEDLEGMPRLKHYTTSDYMKEIETTIKNPNTHTGELYLELHRGTLTNQHDIKRNNRKAEIALHDLEFMTVKTAVEKGEVATDDNYRNFTEDILVHQFHDILPGSSINIVHTQAKEVVGNAISKLNAQNKEIYTQAGDNILVTNTLSFDRDDVVYVDAENINGYVTQKTENVSGESKLAVMGVLVPAFASVSLEKSDKAIESGSAFTRVGNVLETPFAKVTFTDRMYIESFIDKAEDREICGEGYALNTFLMAEDVPLIYDNWDLDKDIDNKFHDDAVLVSSAVVSDGLVEYRIRNVYKIGECSTLTQDMIFKANTALVTFETVMDWNDKHRFLKTAFDTDIFANHTKQEVQFGYISHPVSRNNIYEQAKFEVVNHKYSDLSEKEYGVSILNDCKYGISIENGKMRLSLHKSGLRPDEFGDSGIHLASYGLLPHSGDFSATTVTRPAYEFNYAPVVSTGSTNSESFVKVDNANVIVEAIKPSEDGDKAFIVRLYEAVGSRCKANISFSAKYTKLENTNMLEEYISDASEELVFTPFEIKTLKVWY